MNKQTKEMNKHTKEMNKHTKEMNKHTKEMNKLGEGRQPDQEDRYTSYTDEKTIIKTLKKKKEKK